jgi:pimeloyl-ACP methyl ester carboxylesterase
MDANSEASNQLEQYLLRLRVALRNVPEGEKKEILSDIRCHIAERVEESERSAEEVTMETLRAFGSPESLAETYRAERLLQRAAANTFNPLLLLRATFRWALVGVEGFFALMALFAGYAISASFLACAVVKPIFPDKVGLWVGPHNFDFGVRFPSPQTHEILGWWIVPLALSFGLSSWILTTKFGRWLLRRFLPKLRTVHPRKFAQAVLLLLFASITLHAQSPSLVGKWSGVLDAGSIKLHVGLDVSQGSNGALNAKLSVVEQSAELPVDSITLTGDRVSFTISRIAGAYQGTLKAGRIQGTWSQGGQTLPLEFEQGSGALPVMRRPQNPTPPFPYNVEEVTVPNGAITLAGTFTCPKTGGRFPAVLLITGSGPEDRDETVFGHKPFLVLSDYLTRSGFAVLRLDDRGTGKSTGQYKTAGLEDFTSDASAAVSWLKARPDVDRNKIGLIGHSEGGAIAPLVAVRSQDIAFIVLMAGPGVPFDQLMYRQEADLMRAEGAPESAISANKALVQQVFAIVREEPDQAKARERLDQLATATKAQSPELAAALQEQAPGMILPEFRSLLTYNPADTLPKLKCPLLAINGSKDLQVAADDNLPGIASALAAGHNPDFTVESLPGLNHLFQTAKTGGTAEYATTEETISPRALKVIGDWLLAHVQQPTGQM